MAASIFGVLAIIVPLTAYVTTLSNKVDSLQVESDKWEKCRENVTDMSHRVITLESAEKLCRERRETFGTRLGILESKFK